MQETIVDVAEMRFSNAVGEVLVAPSLGSCVAISLYDPIRLAGGILIFMLPKIKDVSFPGAQNFTCMFGDTGIPAFLKAAEDLGLDRDKMQVTLAGGGQIAGQNESFNIGQRNCQIAKKLLSEAGLIIQQESTGGIYNRTLQLEMAGGKVMIINSGQEVHHQ